MIFAAFAALPSCEMLVKEDGFWAKKGISESDRERVMGMDGPGLPEDDEEEEEDDPPPVFISFSPVRLVQAAMSPAAEEMAREGGRGFPSTPRLGTGMSQSLSR